MFGILKAVPFMIYIKILCMFMVVGHQRDEHAPQAFQCIQQSNKY